MPSPVAHSIIGLAIAVQYAVPPGHPSSLPGRLRARAGVLVSGVALANLPDVDYLPGVLTGDFNAYHHLLTHSIGWVAMASAAWWLVWRAMRPAVGWREAVFVFAAAASHLAADWLTDDGRPPYGIMIAWPFSNAFFISAHPLFWRLMKRDWSDVLQWHNVWAVGLEMVICAPILALALFLKWRAHDRPTV